MSDLKIATMQLCPECHGTGISDSPPAGQSYAERREGQFQSPSTATPSLSYAEARAAQFHGTQASNPPAPGPCEWCKRSGVKGLVPGEPLTIAELKKLLGLPVKATGG
jgi:hypothetical protein